MHPFNHPSLEAVIRHWLKVLVDRFKWKENIQLVRVFLQFKTNYFFRTWNEKIENICILRKANSQSSCNTKKVRYTQSLMDIPQLYSAITFEYYNLLNMNLWLRSLVYITTSFNLIYMNLWNMHFLKIEISCNRMQFSKMLHEVSETKVLHRWRYIEYRKLCNTTTVHQFYIVCMHILWTDFKWSLNCMLRNSIYYTLTYVRTL